MTRNISFRLIFSFALVILLCQGIQHSLRAQTFQVDTIIYNGDPSKFINCVFMGDGFQSTEFAFYASNVQALTNYLFNITPFKEYVNYFNVFAIKVPSVESGADHPRTAPDCPPAASHPLQDVDTYFNSSFDRNNIHRLLVPLNAAAIWNVLLNNFPQYDQKLILVNTPYYGGSGGSNATFSLHASAFEIMVHEIGHSFAGLGDEYWAGDGYAGEKINMTQETNPALVKWKNWMGTGGVGIYQHCCGGTSANWYRPHQGCKMRYLGTSYPFCPVCTEAIVEKIHQKFGTPVISQLPATDTLSYCEQALVFSISTIKPVPNTLRVIWTLNNDTILKNSDSISIDSTMLITGGNNLSVVVMDTTPLSRSDGHYLNNIHTYTINWIINYMPIQTPVITPGGQAAICQGDTVMLITSPAASYLWSNGDTVQNITVSAAGHYSLTITDANGCSAASAGTEILVNPLPPASITPGGTTEFCQGGSVTLTADSSAFYFWSDSSVSGSIVVTNSGNYFVTVTDSNGCQAASSWLSVTVYSLPPVPVISANMATLSSDAAAGNQWYLNGTIISGADEQTYEVTQNGTYMVCITDTNGCTTCSASYDFFSMGTQESAGDNDFRIIPNPNNGKFRIIMYNQRPFRLSIYNVLGQIIYETKEFLPEIDLTLQPKGIYYIRGVSSDAIMIKTLVID